MGFDAIKAHEICMKIARKTGGVVLPPTFWGVGGGHREYQGSIIARQEYIEPLILNILGRLRDMGFRVIVAITGHYPNEQVEMLKKAAEEQMRGPGAAKVFALAEYEAYPAERRADHAAKWETSIMMALRPELVEVGRLKDGRDNPLYGIMGEDPSRYATKKLGAETVSTIVKNMAERVKDELRRVSHTP
jgi:creatinine amidohydrolase